MVFLYILLGMVALLALLLLYYADRNLHRDARMMKKVWKAGYVEKQVNLGRQTSSTKLIVAAALELFDRIVNKELLVRRMYVVANHIVDEGSVPSEAPPEQLDLFTDYEELNKQREQEKAELERERRQQEAVIALQKRYGKNAVLKGMNFEEGTTTKKRNRQIGGHKAE